MSGRSEQRYGAVVEALIVLKAGAGPDAYEALLGSHRVIAALPPRLFVLDVGIGEPVALRAHPAVELVLTADAELPGTGALSDTESLFVDSWKLRHTAVKPRPGDGRDWDAPGFTPPGAPPNRR
ncbi:hypothetical protein [Croceibacterium ferulae]|uniref:hypothetical protein n=1 Tax=Croceibacterium ferulae TaxID=1854641 RepID=UPI000EB06FBC|nr:hypothetical protein [Croceibacterium ferulae]